MIAHRLSTIQRADRIVVLDAGAIVEMGSHEELMGINGPYRNMVELQRLEMQSLGGRQDRAELQLPGQSARR